MSSGQKDAIKIGFAYVGVVLGAGFSTGQEILQFFTNFGMMSFATVILSALVIMFIGRQAAKLGHRMEAESHLEPIKLLFGDRLGTVVDYILIFFLYGVMIIMLAGGGSAFEESFGVPAWLGSLLMAIAVLITLTMNFNKILTTLGAVTPALIIIVMVIAAYSMFNPSMPLAETAQYTDIEKTPTGIWWLEAITYSGIVLAMAFSILSIVGSQSTMKVAKRGGLYGGIILLILMLLMNGGLLAKIDVTSTADLPTLILAAEIHPLLSLALTIVMLLIIYNTAVGMLYPFLSRFWTPYTRKYKIALVTSVTVGYFLSLVGFVDLVNFFYPILGYLGIAIAVLLTALWVKSKVQGGLDIKPQVKVKGPKRI
ncbi:YkvI family membrane protein [Salinicoccus halitifaciens]|uniref:Membrane protein YkvI n=1 Tax=Salinicoccus halitifaciens TaxID=1073415 RepID=A0ABV2ECM7_9STAP|nr:hypothetical protein [Salinicoccus halitifaciens]MCD2138763.1 hypothetical protein [Salinicoccus halitifaciens]